jgi:uncharacterized protein involved in high-affinity Fe2+ transport
LGAVDFNAYLLSQINFKMSGHGGIISGGCMPFQIEDQSQFGANFKQGTDSEYRRITA